MTIALITGANKGIGRQVARRLAAEGFVVYLGARDSSRGERAAKDLAADGDVRYVALDVTDPAQAAAAAERIGAEHGRLDVLVNNAGVCVEWGVPADDITAEHLRTAYEVNVFGVVTVTRACLSLLRASAAPRVINMSSPLGSLTLLGDPDNPIASRHLLAYSSSKSALNALTLLYANALRGDGIRVNAVSPGLVATDLNAASPFSRGNTDVAAGADAPVALALATDGPTGTFVGADGRPEKPIPW